MAVDERAQLAESAEALTLWEKVLEQFRGTLDSATYRDWVDYRIRATRAAALGVQVQLIAPVPARPHVLEVASAERPDGIDLFRRRDEVARAADRDDPLAEEANEQWQENESRAAWGDR